MNPLEFPWTEEQTVTVINPNDEPFKFKVHNKDYELGAHVKASMPGYMAWLYVYNQAVAAAQADGVFNRWNEEDFRPTYYQKFYEHIDALIQEIEEEPDPISVLGDDEDPGDDGVGKDKTPNPAPGTGVSVPSKPIAKPAPAKTTAKAA